MYFVFSTFKSRPTRLLAAVSTGRFDDKTQLNNVALCFEFQNVAAQLKLTSRCHGVSRFFCCHTYY
jgi:hypothetical protein